MSLEFNKRTKDSKRKKFIELAKKRVERVCKGLDLISNLSNPYYYEWEDDELRTIARHLLDKLNEVESTFANHMRMKNKDKKKEFTFDK